MDFEGPQTLHTLSWQVSQTAPHTRAWNLVALTPLPWPPCLDPAPVTCQQHGGECTCLLAIFRMIDEHLIPTLWSEEDNACYVNPVAIIVGHLMG